MLEKAQDSRFTFRPHVQPYRAKPVRSTSSRNIGDGGWSSRASLTAQNYMQRKSTALQTPVRMSLQSARVSEKNIGKSKLKKK